MCFQNATVGSENIDHRARPALHPTRCRDDITITVPAHAIYAAMRVEIVQDVVFANGGLTATGGHPIRLREQLLERGQYPGFTKESLRDHGYYVIDSPADLESKWEAILANRPDFIKAFLLRSEEFEKRRDSTDYFGRKGLDPKILGLIVERAHAANLRVSVHVETGTDFHHAISAGADEIAHLPGYNREPQTIRPEDAALAAERGVVVITTAGLARQQRSDPELYEAIRSAQRANLRLLHELGVRIAIGSDNFVTTSVSEAEYLDELGVFDRPTLLRMLCETTPKSIFPRREIGLLAEGYEATFLALEGDPLMTSVTFGGSACASSRVTYSISSPLGPLCAVLRGRGAPGLPSCSARTGSRS